MNDNKRALQRLGLVSVSAIDVSCPSLVKWWRFVALFESNWISWFKKMSVLLLSYWESNVYWRQNSKYFAELAPQNGGKHLIWRNYVTVTLCIAVTTKTMSSRSGSPFSEQCSSTCPCRLQYEKLPVFEFICPYNLHECHRSIFSSVFLFLAIQYCNLSLSIRVYILYFFIYYYIYSHLLTYTFCYITDCINDTQAQHRLLNPQKWTWTGKLFCNFYTVSSRDSVKNYHIIYRHRGILSYGILLSHRTSLYVSLCVRSTSTNRDHVTWRNVAVRHSSQR